jgi:hypothetical protein
MEGEIGGEACEVDSEGTGDKGGETPYGVRRKTRDDEVARIR